MKSAKPVENVANKLDRFHHFLAFDFDKLLRPVINFYHYEFSSKYRFPIS
jgi:hypothetical protein